MKVTIILLCLLCCFAVAISVSILDSIDQQWEQYKKDFHKVYEPQEEESRKENFKQRVKDNNRHNERFARKEVSFRLSISQFSDLTDDEILKLNENLYISNHVDDDSMKPNYEPIDLENIETAPKCDWREGAVSKVKNIKNCRKSDWAFAAIGALEGLLFQKNGKLTELSAQDLIDCSKRKGNYGCSGGVVKKAYKYVEENGLSTENSYPFKGLDNETCPGNLKKDGIPKGMRIDCRDFHIGSEIAMKDQVFRGGPITASIAISPEFCHYSGGIFTDEDCVKNQTNYNILIVGYGVTNKSEEYWIVKNWWGDTWGEAGYARIAFNKNTSGIATRASYITLGSQNMNKYCPKSST